jgi:putative addiction module component (TIGR02574 family)
MTALATKLATQILSLPCEDRIYLVDALLGSLNAPSEQDIDELWAQEAEHRIDEIDCGKVKLIPGESIFSEIRERLSK